MNGHVDIGCILNGISWYELRKYLSNVNSPTVENIVGILKVLVFIQENIVLYHGWMNLPGNFPVSHSGIPYFVVNWLLGQNSSWKIILMPLIKDIQSFHKLWRSLYYMNSFLMSGFKILIFFFIRCLLFWTILKSATTHSTPMAYVRCFGISTQVRCNSLNFTPNWKNGYKILHLTFLFYFYEILTRIFLLWFRALIHSVKN